MSGGGLLRGAVLGCGRVSEYHLRAWARIPEVEIVALADPVPGKAERRRAEFCPGARTYPGLPELLSGERFDFLDILTPPALHREHCLRAAGAGLHLICQKPLCDTPEDAKRLVEELEGYPRLFAVHENHRYRPWFQSVLRRARDGSFGGIRFLRLEHHDAEPAEAFKRDAERGVLLEYGTHLTDMARALLGEPQRVYARLGRLSPNVRGESLALVTFEYPAATAVIDVAWKPAGPARGSVLVQGDAGEAYFEGSLTRGERSRFRVLRGSETELDEERSPLRDYEESFYSFQRKCAGAMIHGRPTPRPAADYLRTLTAAFAAYESARLGRAIDVPEFAAAVG